MTTEDEIAIAEACGYVWYRHPSANSLNVPHYKFLAHPTIHECEQSAQWMVRADGSEKPCSLDYMKREFYFPNFDKLHEMQSAVLAQDEEFQREFALALANIWHSKTKAKYIHQLTVTDWQESFVETLKQLGRLKGGD